MVLDRLRVRRFRLKKISYYFVVRKWIIWENDIFNLKVMLYLFDLVDCNLINL